MDDNDKRVIRGFAAGRGDYRAYAVEAYRRGLAAGEAKASVYMLYMSEVCNNAPDLALRARYRHSVISTHIIRDPPKEAADHD